MKKKNFATKSAAKIKDNKSLYYFIIYYIYRGQNLTTKTFFYFMSKILIIEDEAAIRRVLLKILSEENPDYKVSEAEDGLQGVELIKKENFDLILCDIKII